MYFDTHAHYDDAAFDADRDELLLSVNDAGVELIVDPATDIASAVKARDISRRHGFVYFAAGVHPEEAVPAPEDYLGAIRDIARDEKCVAIGEIGLDYHWDAEHKSLQKRLMDEQLELAREMGLPAIIHERDATADMLDILRAHRGINGVVHCFSGSWETAREILDMGLMISFTGVVTFKNARRAVEVAQRMPLDRMMIETDSPYMAPVPHRGERNSSLLLCHIAERIAEIRGVTAEEIAAATTENGKRFFGIKP